MRVTGPQHLGGDTLTRPFHGSVLIYSLLQHCVSNIFAATIDIGWCKKKANTTKVTITLKCKLKLIYQMKCFYSYLLKTQNMYNIYTTYIHQ